MYQRDVIAVDARRRKRAVQSGQEAADVRLADVEVVGAGPKWGVECTDRRTPPPRHTEQELTVDGITESTGRRRQPCQHVERLRHLDAGASFSAEYGRRQRRGPSTSRVDRHARANVD